jgi:glycosyltransferase involved in cell wall biosynthesis
MLIYVYPKYIDRGKTGKGRFMCRLVQAWHDMGIQTTDDKDAAADIAIHVSRVHSTSKARKHVLRASPACIDTNMDYNGINHEKAHATKLVDAIVYQSANARDIYHKLVYKTDKPETVIYNGADPNYYAVFPPPYESNFKFNFLASTRVWTKQKRLKDIIKSFLLADIPDALLMVNGDVGDIGDKYNDLDNVMFFGPVNDDVLARMYKLVAATGAYIHGVWVDACPNSMVEAQVAGCPVICTDQGGAHEILRYGTPIRDVPFNYKPVNLNNPPHINREAMAKAMRYYAFKEGDIDAVYIQPDDLYIQNVAKQYINFFEKVLA